VAPARPAPARRAPVSPRRGGADDEEGEERTRPIRKRGVGSGTLVLLSVVGAGIFVVVMVLLFMPGGSANKDVFLRASELADATRYAEAIRYARENWDPGGEDFARVRDEVAKWEEIVRQEEQNRRDDEARRWLRENVEKRTRTSGFSPKGALPDEEVAKLLKQFLADWSGTGPALDILSDKPGEPWETYRHILRNHAARDADVGEMLDQARRQADGHVQSSRFGAAMGVYDSLKQTWRLLLDPELFRTLSRRAEEAQNQLLEAARAAFDREMADIRRLAREGNERRARAQLQWIVDTFGVPALVNEAKAELEQRR
jgi:hypothetical protein